MKKFIAVVVAVGYLSALALALSPDDVIGKIQSNQKKVKDLYAETTTTIVSSLTRPGAKAKGPQQIVQKGKMWNKGEDKSKIEMTSPMKQVTVTNGDKMAVINPETGQKMIQDLKKMREKSGLPASSREMSLSRAKDFFKLSAQPQGDGYLIVGIPKKANQFLGKLEFYVDGQKWVPTRIMMYDPKGNVVSRSDIEYSKIAGVYVPVKNESLIVTPAGKMQVEMTFTNIKINRGIDDKEFKIE